MRKTWFALINRKMFFIWVNQLLNIFLSLMIFIFISSYLQDQCLYLIGHKLKLSRDIFYHVTPSVATAKRNLKQLRKVDTQLLPFNKTADTHCK